MTNSIFSKIDKDILVCNKNTKSSIEYIMLKKHNLFLLKGQSGCGKTTVANFFANKNGASNKDGSLVEIDCAQNAGIDNVRNYISIEILNKSMFTETKVIILDEAHKITDAAQNALLITFQNIPENTYVFLCSTDPSKIIPTIKNRCHIVDLSINLYDDIFERSLDDLYKNIVNIIIKENNNISINKEIFESIYLKLKDIYEENNSYFSIRKFILDLNYLFEINLEKKSKEDVDFNIELSTELEEDEFLIQILRFLSNGGIKHNYQISSWSILLEKLNKIKLNPEQIRISILNYFYSIIMKNPSEEIKIANSLDIIKSFIKFGSFDCIDGKHKLILSFGNLFKFKMEESCNAKNKL